MEPLSTIWRGFAGIYVITNQIDGKVYVGSTEDLYRRSLDHIADLKRGKHRNRVLQHAVNKYGLENFKIQLLEFVNFGDIELLLAIEQKHIDETNCLDRKYGYNLAPIAGKTTGYKHTEVQIQRNRLAKIKKPSKLVINESIAQKIKEMIVDGHYSLKEIAEITNVDYDIVSSIRKGKAWNHVSPFFDPSSQNRKAQLDPDKVLEIKKRLSAGDKVTTIADDYGVNYRTISRIKNNEIWKEVSEPVTTNTRRKRFTPDKVNEIRQMIATGCNDKTIAQKFNCSKDSINQIRNGHSFKNN